MNVYSIELDSDNYQGLELVNLDADWEAMYRFDGTPVHAWEPLRVAIVVENKETDHLPRSDFPSLFANVPVLSGRAVDVLSALVGENGQLLPLDCEGCGNYVILNVTNVVDALDEKRSQIIRFPDGKKVLDIKHFVFIPSKLGNVDIFKLPQQPLGQVFVTDRFVKAVREAGLVGINFVWLWSADQKASMPLQTSQRLQ